LQLKESNILKTPSINLTDSTVSTEREQRAAIALIKAEIDGTAKFLFQFNEKWKRYNLISGKEDAADSGDLSRTASRELCEELDISHADFHLQPLAIVQMTQFSQRLKVHTKYEFFLYHVFFKQPFDRIHSKFGQPPNNRWFSVTETQSSDGKISETATKVLKALLKQGIDVPTSFPL
jgi:hypothetical protein